MQTKVGKDLQSAIAFLSQGKVIGIPTETVYGLAGDIHNTSAIEEIFNVKERPSYDPLIVHAADRLTIENLVVESFSPLATALAQKFWPGPLTLVLPKKHNISSLITSGLPNVAVRIPSQPLFLKLLKSYGIPLAAPSANPFGYVSPTTAQHVFDQLGGKIPYILDGGPSTIGLESTIVQPVGNTIRLLRIGSISEERLSMFGEVVSLKPNETLEKQPSAPGMLEKHYAPMTPLFPISSFKDHGDFLKYGAITFTQPLKGIEQNHQIVLSETGDLDEVARKLYGALRQLDKLNLRGIYIDDFPENGIGAAINDRLRRAKKR